MIRASIMQDSKGESVIFPKWLDSLRPVVGAVLGILPLYFVVLFYYGGSPRTTDVGYAPEQPVPYSHALHAGDLGIDCRYCHTSVEDSAFANIPPTATCMNCHTGIHAESPKLAPVRASLATAMPVPWIRVHDLPDYAYFDHSAHVRRGVGCVECHGRIDEMELLFQAEPLSMGWCLECHRDPEPRLRPLDEVTNMAWTAAEGEEDPRLAELKERFEINPPEDCSACHR
jgi:hypothetical protein